MDAASHGACAVAAPPGPISKATAGCWAPELQAASGAYGLIPAADPSLLARQARMIGDADESRQA